MRVQHSFDTSKRLEELLKNIEELEGLSGSSTKTAQIKIDWFSPLSVLPIVVYSNALGIELAADETTPDETKTYLKRMKFPCGVTSLADWRERYLPILKVKINKTLATSPRNTSILDEYEKGILGLCDLKKPGNENALRTSTSELEDNVKEHSGSEHYWISAQYWKRTKVCEICFVDNGKGYKESYKNTPYAVETDANAVLNALSGNSSKKPYGERGRGIPTLFELLKNCGGELVIITGNAFMYSSQTAGIKINESKVHFPGVAIGIRFATNKLTDKMFYASLNEPKS